jgi:aryl-alcohol dehydrogenase-like predicted oxidoreductase
MKYRKLGRSGLMVSTLTLGTMTWGGEGVFAAVGSAGVGDARRQLDMAMAAGVNILDTADIYSWGKSEEIIGEILKGRRNRIIVATKARAQMGDGPNDRGLSRQHMIEACEASLKRLGTDYIDLYQLHGWDGLTPIDETLRALDDLTRAGKVRYCGVSNFSAWHLMKALHESEMRGIVRPISHQIYYSLVSRDAEWELLPVAVDQGVGLMIWSPLASGMLSGKYRRGQPDPTGTRIGNWTVPPRPDFDHLHDIVDVLVEIAEAKAATPAQVAIAWLLTRPAVATVIIGARTEAQLADNLNAAELVLSAGEVARIEIVSRRPLPYPQWQQVAISRDRLSEADLAALGPYLAV